MVKGDFHSTSNARAMHVIRIAVYHKPLEPPSTSEILKLGIGNLGLEKLDFLFHEAKEGDILVQECQLHVLQLPT